MKNLRLTLLLLGCAACYPAIAHPTRVGSGFSVLSTLGMNVTKDLLLTDGTTGRGVYPTFGINAALSVRDTSSSADGPGFRISVGTGFSSPIWQAYMELPRSQFGPYDAGMGIALHGVGPRLVMPYLQFGREFGQNRFWSTQQGVAFASTSTGVPSGPIWLPTVAVASGVAGGEASLFVTGVVGGHSLVHQEICGNCADDPRRVLRSMLLMGVSWGQVVISNLPLPGVR